MSYPLLQKTALDHVSIGELQSSKKGAKILEIKFQNDAPIWQLSSEALYSPFQAGVYQKDSTIETRQNLDLHITDELYTVLKEFDKYFALELKKIMPKATYHNLVQQEGDYPARIRLKVNANGPNAARFWKTDKTPLGDIRTIKNAGIKMIPCVTFTKAWTMGSLCGVTAELRAAVITDEVNDLSAMEFPL